MSTGGIHVGGQSLVLVEREINRKNLNQPLPSQMSEHVRTKTYMEERYRKVVPEILQQKERFEPYQYVMHIQTLYLQV